jgi:hypothetical protein
MRLPLAPARERAGGSMFRGDDLVQIPVPLRAHRPANILPQVTVETTARNSLERDAGVGAELAVIPELYLHFRQ